MTRLFVCFSFFFKQHFLLMTGPIDEVNVIFNWINANKVVQNVIVLLKTFISIGAAYLLIYGRASLKLTRVMGWDIKPLKTWLMMIKCPLVLLQREQLEQLRLKYAYFILRGQYCEDDLTDQHQPPPLKRNKIKANWNQMYIKWS